MFAPETNRSTRAESGPPGHREAARSTRLRAATLAAALAFLAACSSERELTGDEIRALFADHTVSGHHQLHDYDFESYYATDGTFTSDQGAERGVATGTWWLDGDRICIRWDASGDTWCRVMIRTAGGSYMKAIRLGDGTYRIVVFFREFVPGRVTR